ncbi:MAG: imidazolonepropionase [Myxococcales bacterium]|nr:imidazolonepropionase [Myxococcales bacterium]
MTAPAPLEPRAYRARRLVTCDAARATADDPLGALDDAGFVVDERGRFAFVGAAADLPRGVPCTELDGLVTPGLIDAHTHAAWVGSRHVEYALRMAGADYRAIADAGGGIVASHRAVAEATEAAIADVLTARLARMVRLGVTTCEVKSGYGLTPELELRQLSAIAQAAARDDAPTIVPTFLGLHALPPAARADRAGYVDRVVDVLLPEIAARGLARYVDAYVDANAFTPDEATRLARRAATLGLPARLHVGQFADVGGAELCAELSAHAADHLEHVGPRGVDALAAAGVAAGLLPVASFTLGQAPPPVEALRRAGVALVVASDANPGTAPTESLPLALALAVRLYGLTPAEALLGATRRAAACLGLGARKGAIAAGLDADFAHYHLPHEIALVQPWGTELATYVARKGRTLYSRAR